MTLHRAQRGAMVAGLAILVLMISSASSSLTFESEVGARARACPSTSRPAHPTEVGAAALHGSMFQGAILRLRVSRRAVCRDRTCCVHFCRNLRLHRCHILSGDRGSLPSFNGTCVNGCKIVQK